MHVELRGAFRGKGLEAWVIEFLVQDGDRDLKFTLNPQSYQTYSYEKSNTLWEKCRK